jgi:hypothetical protein
MGALSPGGKPTGESEADHSPKSSARVRNVSSWRGASLDKGNLSIVWYLVKYMYDFMFLPLSTFYA